MFAVAQLGARRHYSVPRIVAGAGLLEHFYTDLVAVRGWPRILRGAGIISRLNGVLGRMNARIPDGIPPSKITHWPAFAVEYFLRERRARTPAEVTSTYLWAGQEFCRRIISAGLGNARGVYTYNSAGLELLGYARDRGLLCVVDQTIAPIRVEDRLLAEEHEAWPDWEIPCRADPYRNRLASREQAEWNCADLIVCGSEFVQSAIGGCGGPLTRCVVIPYGVNITLSEVRQLSRPEGRLHVLVAGRVGLRKGVPHVLKAARVMNGLADFRWCGSVGVKPGAVNKLNEHVELKGVVPRPQMPEQYAWADVLLLPTVCEGSAGVCYEALAAGRPVITTPNAGSVVRDGVDGFIVPIRDSEAVVEKLELLARDRDLWEWMSRNAQARAREFTVEKYGERLVAAIQEVWAARAGSAESQLLSCGGK